MATYTVTIEETQLTTYTVEAETPAAACEAVINGNGQHEDSTREYAGVRLLLDATGEIPVPAEYQPRG